MPPKQNFATPTTEVDTFINDQIDQKILRRATEEEIPYLRVHTPFVVLSANKKRIVVDFRSSNNFFEINYFKLKGLKDLLEILPQSSYFTKLDLKSAYYQLPLNQNTQLAIANSSRQIFIYNGLPLGVSFAPIYYSKFMYYVIAFIQQKFNIQLFSYIDDILIFSSNEQQLQDSTILIKHFIETRLGFIINAEKSITKPSQKIEFLGHIIDTKMQVIDTPKKKMTNIRKLVRRYAFARTITKRKLAKLKGKLASILQGSSVARAALSMISLPNTDSWDQRIRNKYKAKLLHVLHLLKIHHQPNLIGNHLNSAKIFSDASNTTLGIYIKAPWTQMNIIQSIHLDMHQQKYHINIKETLAALAAIHSAASIANKLNLEFIKLILFIDNKTTLHHLKRQKSIQPWLTKQIQQTFLSIRKQNLLIRTKFVPSKENLADKASRSNTLNDYKLNPVILQQAIQLIFNEQRNITIDLFASYHNRQCQRYVSHHPEQQAIATDTLTQSLHELELGDLPYANPPFCILTKFIQKCMKEKINILLVYPIWPGQGWFQIIQKFAQKSIILPRIQQLFSPPINMVKNHKKPIWNTAISWINFQT